MARASFDAAVSSLTSLQSAHEAEIQELSAEIERLSIELRNVELQRAPQVPLSAPVDAAPFLPSAVVPVHATAPDGEATWHVHREILARSPYFLAYLERWHHGDALEFPVPEEILLRDAETFVARMYRPRRATSFADAVAMFRVAEFLGIESRDELADVIHHAQDSDVGELQILAARYGYQQLEDANKRLGNYITSQDGLITAIVQLGSLKTIDFLADKKLFHPEPRLLQKVGADNFLVLQLQSVLKKRASVGKGAADVAHCLRMIRTNLCRDRPQPFFFSVFRAEVCKVAERETLRRLWEVLRPSLAGADGFREVAALFAGVESTWVRLRLCGCCCPGFRVRLRNCMVGAVCDFRPASHESSVLAEMRSDMIILGVSLVDAGELPAETLLEELEKGRPGVHRYPVSSEALLACLRSSLRQELAYRLVGSWGLASLSAEVQSELRR